MPENCACNKLGSRGDALRESPMDLICPVLDRLDCIREMMDQPTSDSLELSDAGLRGLSYIISDTKNLLLDAAERLEENFVDLKNGRALVAPTGEEGGKGSVGVAEKQAPCSNLQKRGG